MDWKFLLKAQQIDFIERLKSGHLLHSELEGRHSELTTISGDKLNQLRDFCWEMVRKYRPNDPKKYFINNMKGKLGEEVIKARLGNFVTEVDYEQKVGGDGKIDFYLTSEPSVGIQVKARYGNFDTVQWSISKEETEKNAVLVCVLIHEEVSEAQASYNLVFAGFIPTTIIKNENKTSVHINELLYCSGLQIFLESCTKQVASNSLKSTDECNNSQIESTLPQAKNNHYPESQFLILANEYFNLAKYYYQKYDDEKAIAYYTQVLKLNPYFVEAYFSRGIACNNLGKYQEAIADFDRVIEINPSEFKAYNSRGISCLYLNDKQEAANNFNIAVNIIKNTAAEIYYNRGYIFYCIGKIKEAIDDFTESIKMNQRYYLPYLIRGICRSIIKDKEGAIKDYTITVRMNPKCDEAYFYLGLNAEEVGNIKRAITYYNAAIATNKNNYKYYLHRGNIRYKMRDNNGAIADYTSAININLSLDIAFSQRGTVRYKLKDKSGAVEDYTQAININPKDFTSYFNRSVARYELGDKQGAIKDYNQACSINPQINKSKKVNQMAKILFSEDASLAMFTNSYQEHESELEELWHADDDGSDDDFYFNQMHLEDYY